MGLFVELVKATSIATFYVLRAIILSATALFAVITRKRKFRRR
jgi:hypothetical protein